MKRITVVGAANVDIIATPVGRYVPCDSNPARVEISYGGVGRNIAHNLSLLGVGTRLVTVFGDDGIALSLRDHCRDAGLVIDPFHEVAGARSNYFICVNDDHGDMQAGAADMAMMEHLTPEVLAMYVALINEGDACAVDCNITPEALRYVAKRSLVPIYIDATSAAKAVKIKELFELDHAAPVILKLNRAEARALVSDKDSLADIAAELLERGISRVYITQGPDGIYCRDRAGEFELPSRAIDIVNATGAGDAFTAGVIYGEINGLDPRKAAALGVEAAALALQSPCAISDEIKTLKIIK